MRKEGAYLPIRWEYTEGDVLQVETTDEEGITFTSEADVLGNQGWELVMMGSDDPRLCVFKRPYKLCPNCGKRTPFAYASDGGFEPRVNKDCPHCWKWSWVDEALISNEATPPRTLEPPKGPIPFILPADPHGR